MIGCSTGAGEGGCWHPGIGILEVAREEDFVSVVLVSALTHALLVFLVLFSAYNDVSVANPVSNRSDIR